ncbi:MAG: flagellum-specific ATP synthase FliI [Rhodobacteraceae bacterium]|nr:flagellum-specific ATP synthase FliI [Paracoccaceae bacterium]
MLNFRNLQSELSTTSAVARVGRVVRAGEAAVVVRFAEGAARIGDRVTLCGRQATLAGEVVALGPDGASVLTDARPDGIALGDAAELGAPDAVYPDATWLGRLVDPDGRPLDGRPLLRGPVARPLRAAPPPPAARRRLGARLDTGFAVFDTFLPLVRGQRIGLFAAPGVGKSSLMAGLAAGVAADVAVVALVGERGREVRAFVEDALGAEARARTVVVAATSDRPARLRRRAALAATAVAEHFRDAGLHVLLLVDSVTRFADAHRDVALAAGEAAALRGYPPSLGQEVMSLCERAGPGAGDAGVQGDITAVYTVLAAGGDLDGPVPDLLRGTLDGHVILDRAIAERGRFPAVDLLRSMSRSLPAAASAAENALLAEARALLGARAEAELMIQSGLYVPGTDPLVDRAIGLWPALDAFLAGRGQAGGAGAAFAALAAILGRDWPQA